VPGVYDYAGLSQGLALSPRVMLPSATLTASASWLHVFGAQYPAHLFPCLRFAVTPHGVQRKTRGRVDRYSFLV